MAKAKLHTWTVISSYAGNADFEVVGGTVEDAALQALYELGWEVTKKKRGAKHVTKIRN